LNTNGTIFIATRGSALALAQANMILARCQAAFPGQLFQLKIIKTTGDKLQTASLAQENKSLPKGLFTKELEVALLERQAGIAVHSLKDLPTALPGGLKLGAVTERADVRDVLIYRDAAYLNREAGPTPGRSKRRGFNAGMTAQQLPAGALVATSSTRRKAQLLEHRPELNVTDIRGNVVTRMQKLMDTPDLDATVLALAGITRLGFRITPEGRLEGEGVPVGLMATVLDTDVMLPCVGQGAIGIEMREEDESIRSLCERLNHYETLQCVTAERSFLSAMGGGCQSPVGAYARVSNAHVHMRVISFADGPVRRAAGERPIAEASALGSQLAAELKQSAS
jgi:hydroxymethylbilane synthase